MVTMSCGHQQESLPLMTTMQMCDGCLEEIRSEVGKGDPPWDSKTDRRIRDMRRTRRR